MLDSFEPAELAVCEGTGLALARRASALDEQTSTWLGLAATPEPEPEVLDEAKPDQESWGEILALLFPGEPGLESLVRGLIAGKVPRPVQGYELGDAGWQAELAWPEQRIAVVLAGDTSDQETADRNEAYATQGWDAHTAREWSIGNLIEKIMATSGASGEGY